MELCSDKPCTKILCPAWVVSMSLVLEHAPSSFLDAHDVHTCTSYRVYRVYRPALYLYIYEDDDVLGTSKRGKYFYFVAL